MYNSTITVSELNGYIRSIFYAEEMLHNISVSGEVSGFKISGAHAYFVMKSADSAINCTMFNYARYYLPKDGEMIIARGTPDYYIKTGKLSFNISGLQPIGKGNVRLELEQLKNRLTEEGVFSEKHKIAIPVFPQSICVVTSKTGAVIRDIITTVRAVNKIIDIKVYSVKVQGEGSAEEIAHALQVVDGKYDVVIVARGGGSFEDLMPFNTEIVARAVYNMTTPIISAVGHETDYSLCDFAADARAATPTAAAQLAAYNAAAYMEQITAMLQNIRANAEDLVKAKQSEIFQQSSIICKQTDMLIDKQYSNIKLVINNLKSAEANWLTGKDYKLQNYNTLLGAANPTRILSKGYFRLSARGVNISSLASLSVDDTVTIISADGTAQADIKSIVRY